MGELELARGTGAGLDSCVSGWVLLGTTTDGKRKGCNGGMKTRNGLITSTWNERVTVCSSFESSGRLIEVRMEFSVESNCDEISGDAICVV